MSDAFDDRRRGLEEEYFHRKNKEAVEKLREKMKVAEDAKAAGISSMTCPRCGGALTDGKFSGSSIGTCVKCVRVWLDACELLRLSQREHRGWLTCIHHR